MCLPYQSRGPGGLCLLQRPVEMPALPVLISPGIFCRDWDCLVHCCVPSVYQRAWPWKITQKYMCWMNKQIHWRKGFADLVVGAWPMIPLLRLFLKLHAPAPLAFSQQNLQFDHAASNGHLSHKFQQNASSEAPLVRERRRRKQVRKGRTPLSLWGVFPLDKWEGLVSRSGIKLRSQRKTS